MKGSPEKIETLCKPDSVPKDYSLTFNKHTAKGRRVIALAYRKLPDFNPKTAETLKRETVECDLIFLGFLIMINDLKPATIPAIAALKQGGVLSVMATGDNALTGINNAQK